MRIALLSSDPDVVFGNGHACPARLRGLAQALARSGHEVHVILSGTEAECDEPSPAFAVRKLRLPVSVREIDWHLSRVQPDIVIERYFPGSLEGAMAASEAGVPHLYDLESMPRAHGLGTSLSVRGALPEALASSRGAIVAHERGAERVRAIMGEHFPVGVVPDAAGSEFLDPPAPDAVARVAMQLRLVSAHSRVAFYGPLSRGGGLLPLVQALGRVAADRRPRLVVIGDGPERNPALAEADSAKVALVLCGRVPQRDASAYLLQADVVVVPGGDDDGAPNALLEAMATSRAVIAPDVDAVRRVVKHGHDAHLVDFADPEALARAVGELLADAPRRDRLGSHARRSVVSRHTWDARSELVARLADRVMVAGPLPMDSWAPASRSMGAER